VKIKDGDVDIDEKIEIDTEKQTETLTVPEADTGKNGNEGEVKVVFDFIKNLTMHRLSATKTCFLSESTENLPKPDDLLKILEYEQVSLASSSPIINETSIGYEAVSTVTDRSILSDEMAYMCAKLPIYLVKKTTSQRVKRSHCRTYRYYRWYWCRSRRRYCRVHVYVRVCS